MKILGLELISWRAPLQRRLETAAVWYFSTSFLFFGVGGLLLCTYILFTSYYYLALIYITWWYYDWNIANEGGRASEFVRNMRFWRYFAAYFPCKLVKTADLDPSKNYIFGFHPHGIIVAGCFCNFGSEATGFGQLFPGLKPHVLTLEGQFWVPFHREALLALGTCSVSRASIDHLLTKEGVGHALVIVVGGASESLDAKPGEATLTIKRRKGFVRMAIIHGAPLVPVYSFGENDLYDQMVNPVGSPLRTIQEKLTKIFGFALPVFTGRGVFNYSFGYLPRRRPIVTVVGKPIDLTKNANPSQEEVDALHRVYLQQLKELYDKFKGKYGDPDLELIFM